MIHFITRLGQWFSKQSINAYSHRQAVDTQAQNFYLSAVAMLRMKKTQSTPLSAQKQVLGANKKRIGLVWMKWLCWAVAMSVCTSVAAAPSKLIGVTCNAATDTFDGFAGPSRDYAASQILVAGGSCSTNDTSTVSSSTSALSLAPFQIRLNSNSAATPRALNNYMFVYHSSITNFKVDGNNYTSGSNLSTTTAGTFSHVITFTHDGTDLTFTSSKAAGTNTLSTFTVAEVPGATAPEIDVQRPVSTSIADGSTDAQGNQATGTETTKTYTVANTGDAVLNVTGVTSANATNVTVGTISSTSFTVAVGSTETFDVPYTPTADGAFSFELDISSDDADEANYDITVSGTAAAATAPEIDVQRPVSTSIADGGTDAQGNQTTGTEATKTYTVANTGDAVLNVTGVTSANPTNVTVGTISSTSFTVAVGSTETFDVPYTPTADGAFSFELDISSDDADEANYDITVAGTAATASSGDNTTTANESTEQTTEFSAPINPGVFGGEKVTPSIYNISISKIEFKNSQGNYVTFAEEGSRFDVASVGSNASVGTFGKTATLPNGTYSEIRITYSNTLGVSVSGTDKGAACRTNGNGSTDSVNSSLTNVATGSSDGGTASEQQINYPSGTAADNALSRAGISAVGSNLQTSKAVAFTISDTSLPPNIGINFDVAGSVEVLNLGSTCYVIPQPPVVNVTVGS